jgi:hypothetical protein
MKRWWNLMLIRLLNCQLFCMVTVILILIIVFLSRHYVYLWSMYSVSHTRSFSKDQ